jgi:predicted metal-binding protein
MKQPVVARSRRAAPILVCRKCLKRCPNGDKIRGRLKHELKRRSPDKKRTPRLVSVNCFGICPRRAAVVASGRSLGDNEYLLVSRPGQVETALEKLLPSA